ncbi:MAG TPA: citrate synthase family protein [Vicinamibacterales bacterium]|nr:citrate synthase family protein [Vicinamibacterales bacterium]
MSADSSWMSAADACRALRISPPTLYAYVSRGFVRSEATRGASRQRRYSRDDVERLRRRKEGRRDPDATAAETLRWGLPVLESSLTLIADNRLYYRGHDAVDLARTRSIAGVASLIWTGTFEHRFADRVRLPPVAVPADRRLPFPARAQRALAAAAAHDHTASDLRAASVALTGWRILSLLTAVAAGAPPAGPALEQTLSRAWRVDRRGLAALRAALVLCADHELNVSSFTARCVASAGSNPYAVVSAGLDALEGTRHGGISLRVESMLAAIRRVPSVRASLADRLRRGETIDGFGHPLYRDGDPRAAAVLDLLRDAYPRSPELAFAREVADRAAALIRERPTIDFALAALGRVLRLPPGTPLVLFAIGRTIGWVGHAIEQYATGQIIRPRAKYVGMAPEVQA